MNLGWQAPIHRIRQKHTKDATRMHRISNPVSHLQRRPTRQSKPTNEAPAPTYTEEGPPTSDPAKDIGQRLQWGFGWTLGSAEPRRAPSHLSFGRKVSTAIPTSVTSVPALFSPGNRPLQAIKGPPLTPLKSLPFHSHTLQGGEVVVVFHLYL